MLSIILNWLYVTTTIFPIGYCIVDIFEKKFKCNLKKFDEILMSGLVFVTVYAQIFSLFYKVSLLANIVLCGISFCCALGYKKEISKKLKALFVQIKIGRLLVFLFLALILCYFTSRGYEHYDTGLYHAQAIRWIEEFGVVPGLGNLNYRIAYNSSAFVVTALYSMEFLIGQSLHTLSGYFLMCMCLLIVFGYKKPKKYKVRVSDLCRIAGFYYITTTFASLNSPASDYFVSAILFYLVIKYIDKIEQKEKNVAVFAWISLISCFAITLKLSAVPMVLIVLYPMIKLLKAKDWKKIATFISLGIVIVIPFLIRGIVISGWLLYPNTTVDLFSFDFKVNEEIAYYDQLVIMLWGRCADIGDTIFQWFPKWLESIDGVFEQVLMISCAVSLVLFVILWVYEICCKKSKITYMVFDITLIVGFCFWFFSAPLIRYGYAYIFLLIAGVIGRIIQYIPFDKFYKLVAIGFLLIALYKVKGTYDLGISWIYFDSYLLQQDYAITDMIEVEKDGITFYYPKNADRLGYYCFPAVLQNSEYELRGEHLKDGFRQN